MFQLIIHFKKMKNPASHTFPPPKLTYWNPNVNNIKGLIILLKN